MISENIKKFRKESGITQQKLANLIGLSLGAVRHYEQGTRIPKESIQKKISEALGVPTVEGCEFCKDKKEKMPENGEFNFAFSIEDNELWAYDGYMDGGAAIKINYCPMCGKKLVEI